MLDSIRFHKYTALGNNFTLIDELDGIVLDERDKFRFAQEYADFDFGIGSNGILFVQRPGSQAFEGIHQTHGHRWDTPGVLLTMQEVLCANTLKADAIMRIIEPNGQESSMCGNGIRCVADYLHRRLKKRELKIIAEVTTSSPRVKLVQRGRLPNTYQVCMGPNSRLPAQFRTALYKQVAQPCSDTVEFVELAVPIPLPGGKFSLALRGYVTYTAEPHLVCFAASTPFVREQLGLCRAHLGTFFEEEEAYRNRILCLLGDFLNNRSLEQGELSRPRSGQATSTSPSTGSGGPSGQALGLFNSSEGINVNIAAIGPNRAEIQMRVYERGSWNTTKACGTGATAVVAIAHELGLLAGEGAKVLTEGSVFSPQGCTIAPSYARRIGELVIEKRGEGWWMRGPVEYIYSGTLNEWKRRLWGTLGDHKSRLPAQRWIPLARVRQPTLSPSYSNLPAARLCKDRV